MRKQRTKPGLEEKINALQIAMLLVHRERFKPGPSLSNFCSEFDQELTYLDTWDGVQGNLMSLCIELGDEKAELERAE